MTEITQPRVMFPYTGRRYALIGVPPVAGETPEFMHGTIGIRPFLVGDICTRSHLSGNVLASPYLNGDIGLNP